ncbi:hypothetical protein INR49_006680 [Caranx melampygus]|nr:hypothetical protein INR49_006680 [Caranx melampygus]
MTYHHDSWKLLEDETVNLSSLDSGDRDAFRFYLNPGPGRRPGRRLVVALVVAVVVRSGLSLLVLRLGEQQRAAAVRLKPWECAVPSCVMNIRSLLQAADCEFSQLRGDADTQDVM